MRAQPPATLAACPGRRGGAEARAKGSSGRLASRSRSGARVHSDSWGSDATAYDDMAADFDRFAWLKPTFLPVVAAGNAGAGDVGAAASNAGNAVGTVSSPAVAKNCLAVAATLTERFEGSPEREEVARERVPGELLVAAVSGGAAGANQARRAHRAVAAVFSDGGASPGAGSGVGTVGGLPPLTALAASASGDWALVAADPIDACSPLRNGNASDSASPASPSPAALGAVVLAWRGKCSFSAKAANAAAAGAAALLIANSGPGGALRMTGTRPPGSAPLAPTAAVSRRSGEDLAAALLAGQRLPLGGHCRVGTWSAACRKLFAYEPTVCLIALPACLPARLPAG